MKINKAFLGWEQIVNDMNLNNELTDIRTINIPNLTDKNI
jgi:hypothetical protein